MEAEGKIDLKIVGTQVMRVNCRSRYTQTSHVRFDFFLSFRFLSEAHLPFLNA